MSGVASSDTFSKLLSTNIVDEEKLTNGIGNGEEEDKSPEMQSAHAKIVDAIAKKSSSASESIEHVSLTSLPREPLQAALAILCPCTLDIFPTKNANKKGKLRNIR